MKNEIIWVNHASYILKNAEVSILTDPWIEFSAFNNGWDLLSPSVFNYDNFKEITHIWFSHEHPDHFSPTVLKKISEDIRKNITILYQKTKDRKIAKFCKMLGFKEVIETSREWLSLSENIKIYIDSIGRDSWCVVESLGESFLNINDCVISNKNNAVEIKKVVPKCDVLFTQFSYANWVGNRGQEDLHKKFAKKKIKRIDLQIEIFNPKFLIPFASFVYFSSKENFYLNKAINKINTIYEYSKNSYQDCICHVFLSRR